LKGINLKQPPDQLRRRGRIIFTLNNAAGNYIVRKLTEEQGKLPAFEQVTIERRKFMSGPRFWRRILESTLVLGLACFSLSPHLAGAQQQWSSAEASLQSAMEAIQAGDFVKARQILEKESRQSPNNVEVWNLLGIARTESHETAGARAAFEHGLKLAPDSVSLNENAGLSCFKAGDYPKAKGYLLKAIEKGSQNPGVKFSLAASRLRTGEPAKALEELKLLENQLSGSSDYWEERGRAELPADPAAAESDFARAIELAPNSLMALNGAASAAEKQGLDEKALAYLIRARQANPNDVSTLNHFGAVCIRRDLGLDARDALEKAHELEPSNNTSLFLLARANISLQNWQRATDLLREFTKRVPSFAPAYYAIGWVDLRLNQRDEARVFLEKCLQLQPKLADARVELAQLDFDDGQAPKAEAEVKKALQTDPKNAKGNQLMSDLLLRQGQIDEAQSYIEKVIEADPKSSAAHYKLAALLTRKHQTERAAQERSLATMLAEESKKESKTQLRLALPDMGIVQ
jgi:tetratricopeptide (TPR) repeat protein